MAQLDDVETLRRLLQMRESELREARRLLERASIYDDATGMLNRAGLTLVVQDRLNWLRRKSEPFAIAEPESRPSSSDSPPSPKTPARCPATR